MKRSRWKTYVFWILLAETVGGLSGWLTRNGVKTYQAAVTQPPLSPPDAVFPVVWGILFALMGVGAARVWLTPRTRERTRGIGLFLVQLGFNFFWSILFFNFMAFGIAFLWLVVLWGLIFWMIRVFRRVDRPAAWIQIPYLLWVAFAGYLNLGVKLLNP